MGEEGGHFKNAGVEHNSVALDGELETKDTDACNSYLLQQICFTKIASL